MTIKVADHNDMARHQAFEKHRANLLAEREELHKALSVMRDAINQSGFTKRQRRKNTRKYSHLSRRLSRLHGLILILEDTPTPK